MKKTQKNVWTALLRSLRLLSRDEFSISTWRTLFKGYMIP